jgi:hypothetical protein
MRLWYICKAQYLGDGDVSIRKHRELSEGGLLLGSRPGVCGVLIPLEVELGCKRCAEERYVILT